MNQVWLIAVKVGDTHARMVSEEDAEGYINALRTKGYTIFHITRTLYTVDDAGRTEAA